MLQGHFSQDLNEVSPLLMESETRVTRYKVNGSDGDSEHCLWSYIRIVIGVLITGWLTVTVIVGFPVLGYYLLGDPYKRGFFCDDESIRHPYKESTVTSRVLYFVGLGVPIITMIITELLHSHLPTYNKKYFRLFGSRVPSWAWICYSNIIVFGFGAASSQLLTDIGKYLVGRLRPHFIDICRPNVDCNLAENRWRYIEDYQCTGTSAKKVHDSRLSFPSGHSSFAVYTMVYTVMYLQARMTWRGSYLLRHTIQFLCLAMAWFTALSRISDYKHHWSDVLAGSILGAVIAFLVARYVSELFREPVYMPREAVATEVEVEDKTSP
ncbi:hypothetical protein M8J76_001316 [Diaphorina citri]|nr:hypothetical protein M8J76_001316 [Diaphorina citri]